MITAGKTPCRGHHQEGKVTSKAKSKHEETFKITIGKQETWIIKIWILATLLRKE